MMHTTLHIISRAMFSANSDEIVEVVERGVSRYQTAVRPGLLALLGFPAWFSNVFSHRRGTAAAFSEFDKAVDELITSRAREPSAQRKDLLARLVAARDAETGDRMTAKEVRDEVVTIFMAGDENPPQGFSSDRDLLSPLPSSRARHPEKKRTGLKRPAPPQEDIGRRP